MAYVYALLLRYIRMLIGERIAEFERKSVDRLYTLCYKVNMNMSAGRHNPGRRIQDNHSTLGML